MDRTATTDRSNTLQTLTLLISDVVASTELRSRLGDAAADLVQREADELVIRAVVEHGGVLVKTLGDGVLATFGSAADALAAATDIQQQAAVRRPSATLAEVSFRVGIAVGDVAASGGDIAGTPVVEARRLCDLAAPDEVLITDLVKLLSGSRVRATFESIGEVELRGLPHPVAASRMLWVPLRDDELSAGHGVELSPLLVTEHSVRRYVGRATTMARLQAELSAALSADSPARTVLISGEPGIGKTRTAAELATAAHAAGGIVLYGRCDEDLHSAYQPFVETLADYVRQAGDPKLGRLAGELRRLEPELERLVPGVGAPLDSDVRSEEYRLFEAVAEWLIAASVDHGLVFVIDDMQWADQPTLMLVRHLLRRFASGNHRLLIVGTHRDDDPDDGTHMPALLSDLRRIPGVARFELTGLTETDVVDIMEAAAGHDLDNHGLILANIIWTETEGNPLFVAEVLRHLRETEAIKLVDGHWVVAKIGALEVPDSVRDVVVRRLARLPEQVRSLLAVAAVIGRNFSLDVVLSTCGLSEETVIDALDLAIAARLVAETDADHYRFNHVLVRGTLYDELSATRRRRLHQKVAAVIEEITPSDVVALAHHHLAAGPSGSAVVPAARWALAAGTQAQEARALAEAEVHYRQAKKLLLLTPGLGAEAQVLLVRVLCGLGECQRDQGKPEFRETLLTAAEAAHAIGDTEALARAVLANDRGSTLVTSPDARRIAQIESALAAVGPEPSALRARLLTRLVGETTFSGDAPHRREVTLAAESMARRLEDPATLSHVLVRTGMAAHRLMSPDESLARAVEASERAEVVRDPALRTLALSWVSAAMVVLGRLREAAAVSDRMTTVALDAAPSVRLHARLNRIKFLAVSGQLDAARAENDACLEQAQALREPDADTLWGAITAAIAMNAGTSADFADAAGGFADLHPSMVNWRAAHAAFLAEAGRLEEARLVLHSQRLDPALMMEEPFAFQGPFSLAQLARRLGRDEGAELATRTRLLLEPYAGSWSHIYLGILGPVSWPLGWCAMTTGDWDTAVNRLGQAWNSTRASGAMALHRLVSVDLAEALRERGGVGDHARADEIAGPDVALGIGSPEPSLEGRAPVVTTHGHTSRSGRPAMAAV